MTKNRKDKHYFSMGIVWVCPGCGAYNLSEVGWEDYICIACNYHIRAHSQDEVKEEATDE